MIDKIWSSRLRYNYGISPADYNKLLKEQNNSCAICGKPPEKVRLAVDHNHANRRVRGLLCFHCNTILGHAYDSVKIIKNALDYITKHSEIDSDWDLDSLKGKLEACGIQSIR